MNIHALLITVLIPNVHITGENELNEILRCVFAAMPILGSVPDASRPCWNDRIILSDPERTQNCDSDQLVSLRCICL